MNMCDYRKEKSFRCRDNKLGVPNTYGGLEIGLGERAKADAITN